MNTENQKRILLSVTGMSPAVITETLYALVVEKQFIPTEIRVITTLQGKNKLLDALLGIEGGRKKGKGALEEFIEDYGEKYGFNQIHFDENSITVIEDENQKPLADIRTPEENRNSADQIVQLVGELCKDPNTTLHVSIAGGRKTMGFFLGYALSLYGRKQDSLSHVLVAEEFENLPSFFYPKPYDYFINDRQGRQINAKNSCVMLAEIPWVRLGLGVSDDLLHNKVSYNEAITGAQQVVEEQKIIFLPNVEDRMVQLGSKTITLSPRGYALLLYVALAKKQGWKFKVNKDEEKIKAIYAEIYGWLKDKDDVLSKNYIEFKTMLSGSKTDIRKKIKNAFNLSNGIKTNYEPASTNEFYDIDIESHNIDISQIKEYLKLLIK